MCYKLRTIFSFLLLQIIFISPQLTKIQAQVINVKLIPPPPNQLKQNDLWRFNVTYSGVRDSDAVAYKMFLIQVDLKERTTGIQAKSSIKSTPFSGSKSFSFRDFKKAGIKYSNTKLKEAFSRNMNAPDGNYTICVYIRNKRNVVVAKDCIEQRIKTKLKKAISLNLISPANESKISTKKPLIFRWMLQSLRPNREITYKIKVAELLDNQSATEAIKRNPAVFEKDRIRTTFLNYPLYAKKLEKGKSYAWQITAVGAKGNELGESNGWTFTTESDYRIDIDTLYVQCDTVKNNLYYYNFTLKITNQNQPGSPGPSNNALLTVPSYNFIPTSAIISNINISPVLTTPLHYSTQTTFTGSFTSTLPLTSATVILRITDQVNSAYLAQAPKTIRFPQCELPENCDGFTRLVDSLKVTSTNLSSGLIQLSGSLVAGPNPITKVSAELVYLSESANDSNCVKYNPNSLNFGNITSGTLGGYGTGAVTAPLGSSINYGREIIWNSSAPAGVNMTTGSTFNINLAMPPTKVLPCCSDTLRFSIRFSFTDSSCVTCDILINVTVIRDSSGIKLIMEKNKMDNLKLNKLLNLPKDENGSVGDITTDSLTSSIKTPGENRNGNKSNVIYFSVVLPIFLSRKKRKHIVKKNSPFFLAKAIKRFVRLTLLYIIISAFSSVRAQYLITITSPSLNSTWMPGQTMTITWTGGNFNTVKIALVHIATNTTAYSIATGILNNGTYTWTIPTSFTPVSSPNNLYKFYIASSNNPSVNGYGYGDNNTFYIVPFVPPTPSDSCSLDTLVIRTGWNYTTGQVYSTGVSDGFWRVRGPNINSGSFLSTAWVIPRYINTNYNQPFPWAYPQPWIASPPLWLPLNPTQSDLTVRESQWLSAIPHGDYEPNEYYEYEFTFCIEDTANAKMVLNIRADDEAKIYLNGTYIASTGSNTFKKPYPFQTTITSNFIPSSNNSLVIRGINTGGEAMGINVYGWVTANGINLQNPICCNPTGNILGFKWIDRNNNGTPDLNEYLPNWTINLLDQSGNIVQTQTTDIFGAYYFLDVSVGTYSVSEQLQNGYSFSDPSTGIYNNINVTAGSNIQLNFKNDTLTTTPPETCCSNFDISVGRYTINKYTNLPGLYSLTTEISAGPNKIKKVVASLAHFSVSHNPDCDRDTKPVESFGSFVNADNISTTPPLLPELTNPFNTSSENSSVREIIWSDASSSVDLLNLTTVKIIFRVPDPSPLECCPDTIRFCIRYKFTDSTGVTCDKLICYEFVQKGGQKPGKPNYNGGVINPTDKELKGLPKELRKEIKEYRKLHGVAIKKEGVN